MKKTFLTQALIVLFCFYSSLPAFASHSAKSKADQLTQESNVRDQTLAAPTFLGSLNADRNSFRASSLLSSSAFETGYAGDILFEKVGNTSFRLNFRDQKEDASFFWLFKQPQDLRDRWVQIDYSSLKVPSKVYLQIDSGMPRTDGLFMITLEDSVTPKSSYFKLPNRNPYASAEKISMHFPAQGFEKNADLMIYDLKLLPKNESPIAKTDESLLQTPDWYKRPIQAQNHTSADELYLQFMKA